MFSRTFRVPTAEEFRETRKKILVIHMLTCFGDESIDEQRARVFAAAGVMGIQEEWDELEPKWLEATGGKVFHATDCLSGWGEYENIPWEARDKEYRSLVQLLVQSRMIGHGAAIDLMGYNEAVRDSRDDATYFYSFLNVVVNITNIAKNIIPQQQIKFVFDINHEVQYNAAFIYENFLVKRPQYAKLTSIMDKELGFATRDKVGIQVADLFAYETMKDLDNKIGPVRRPTRISFEKLYNTKRFEVKFLRESDFRDFSIRNAEQLKLLNKDCKRWLAEQNCLDTTTNRFRYFAVMDSFKKSEK